MLVTLINALSVIAGALLGLLMKKRISSVFSSVVLTSAGLVTLVLGLGMAAKAESVIGVLFTLIIGGFIGHALRIEERVEAFGDRFQRDGEEGSFGLAFLNSSVLFCSGAMSIVGSINAGTTGDGSLILIKSVLDGFMAIIFAASYGRGVLLSALSIIVYQGFFVLAGGWISPVLGDGGINDMAATGGYLLLMIGFNFLESIKNKPKTANYLPSLILAPLFCRLLSLIGC